MSCQQLQDYLYEHIPLSAAMQVQVLECSTKCVQLAAPLAANINHRDTVFGGSAAAIAILSAWSLLHVRFQQQDVKARLVIQHCEMNYDLPIAGDFKAVCRFDDEQVWNKAMKIFQRRGKTRLQLRADLQIDERSLTSMQGDFVALAME